ncbi:MAG: P63C domain-containing protein [Mucilaginibacter sp.]
MSEELKNLPHALCTGDDTFNGVKLGAAILDDEDRTHVFSERSLSSAFGFKGTGLYWQKRKLAAAELPAYLSSSVLKDFISSDLKNKLAAAISYVSTGKKVATGVEATALPLICDVFVKAAAAHPNNEALVKAGRAAYQIILAFSQYGVLKYVEQITGYRYNDEDTIITKQLKEFGVSPVIVEWQREFQIDFYRNIYRLKDWPFNPNTVKRPQVIGTYTNQYVYSYLPKDVFEWMKDNTPKTKDGKYAKRLFQSLDEKRGKELLRNQLVSITTMLKLSRSWQEFKDLFARSLGQTQIDFKEPVMVLPKPKLLEITKKDINQTKMFEDEQKLSDFNKKLTTALNYNPKDKE